MKKSYYVDTCIYLNLWKKEYNENLQLWEFAKDFLEKIEERGDVIYYSGFIMKELIFTLSKEEYIKKRKLFNSNPNFIKEVLTNEEYEEGRNIEIQLKGEIGFYDILHILLSRKTNSILITRDKKLLEVANRMGIEAKKPEEIL